MMRCYVPTEDDAEVSNNLDDIRRSLEALDTVLAEHDTEDDSNDVKIKRNGISQASKEVRKTPLDGLTKAESVKLEQQSLDILDSILAEYEDEIRCDTNDEGDAASSPSSLKCEEARSPTSDTSDSSRPIYDNGEDELESKCDNKESSSPHSQRQLRKSPPPPVPKRSPSTCLSTSSSAECPFPEVEIDNPTLEKLLQIPTTPTSPNGDDSSPADSLDKTPSKKKRGKLSSQPVEKGSRPFVRSLSAGRLDETDSDDSVFDENKKVKASEQSGAAKDMMSQATESETVTEMNRQGHGVVNIIAEIGSEKFALVRFLLRSGQLEGLDEKPPTFKPPPPLTNKQQKPPSLQCTDVNRNEIPPIGSKDDELAHSKPIPHVTSVKIGEPTSPGSPQVNSNISLITFQPKISNQDAGETRKSLASSKSPSQEEAAPNTVLPLELKAPAATNKGAVFFNVFQCDSPQQPNAAPSPPTKEQALAPKKAAKLQKKAKNKKKTKDNAPEDNDACKNNNDAAIDLISELTDKIQTKKSASVGSADDDSDEEVEESQQKTNMKETKTEKGLWKGFWKRKQSMEN